MTTTQMTRIRIVGGLTLLVVVSVLVFEIQTSEMAMETTTLSNVSIVPKRLSNFLEFGKDVIAKLSVQRNDSAALLFPRSNRTKWLIQLGGNSNSCSELKTRFSHWTILLTSDKHKSSLHTAELDGRCLYVDKKDTSIIHILQHALRAGAKAIYLTEQPLQEGIIPSREVGDWREKRTIVLRKTKALPPVYDPTLSWGCGPLKSSRANVVTKYSLCTNITVGIHAALSGSPHLEKSDSPLATSCDTVSPSVVLETGIYSTIPKTGVLFNADAFWALLVAFAEKPHIGLVVQKLLWLTGRHLKVRTGRTINATEAVSDLDKLKTYLTGYICPEEATNVRLCSVSLAEPLVEQGLLSKTDYQSFMDWLAFLDGIQYNYPDIVRGRKLTCAPRRLEQYYGNKTASSSNKTMPNISHINEIVSQKLQATTCSNDSYHKTNLHESKTPVWDDVLLVITYNNAYFLSVPYIEVMYRKMFPHILYCAPNDKPIKYPNQVVQNLDMTFVYYHETPSGHLHGTYFYECGILAAAMRYDVRGYLVIADDVIMAPENMKHYNRDKIWFLPHGNHLHADYGTRQFTHIGTNKKSSIKQFTPYVNYENQTKTAMRRIQQMTSPNARHCVKRLTEITGNAIRPLATFPDAWYIPATKIDAAAELMTVFLESESYLAIVLATVFDCITDPDEYQDLRSIYATTMNVYRLPGLMKKGMVRENVWKFLHPNNIHKTDFMHPYKLSHVYKKETKHVHYFCRYLDYLYDPAGKFIL